MHVVVVGAGLGGLSAACHLSGAGHEVTVVERGSIPGGRAGLIAESGFRIDTGPSVLTMVDILRDTFRAAGADMEDFVRILPVDPMYRATFTAANGTSDGEIRVLHGRDAMREEISAKCGTKEAQSFGVFCDWLTKLYKIEMPNFIDRNFDSPLDLARPMKPGIDLLRAGGFKKLNTVVKQYFNDERLQKLFSFQSMYAGLSPFNALALYGVITYMDTVEGVYFPEGGMNAVAQGLADAATKAGTSFRYNENVTRIVRETGDGGPVKGIRLESGEMIACEVVVCNPDLPSVYRELLPETSMPLVARHGNYSPSCALWLAGVKGKPSKDVAHHNIHFGSDWKGAFDALLKTGKRMPDPSILVSVQNHTDPSIAPEDCSILYVLEPTPNLDGKINWTAEREGFRESLVQRVGGLGYPTKDIRVERFIDPSDWEAMGMERGTPFALSHKLFQTGPFRPKNIDSRVPGFVLVGSGTQPGVGVPMVIISGKLAAQRVEQIRAKRQRSRD